MDLSAIIVTIGGTVLFFGFAAWMAIYSRRIAKKQGPSTAESKDGK